MPDIDSLPSYFSSPRLSGPETRHSPSPRPSNASLAAAATINAGIEIEDYRRLSNPSSRDRGSAPTLPNERRRSSAVLGSYDPALPGPGELLIGDSRFPNGDLPSPRPIFGNRTASPQGSGSPTLPPRHRDRTPSLGEIHQQLEQEQEAQVVSGFWIDCLNMRDTDQSGFPRSVY